MTTAEQIAAFVRSRAGLVPSFNPWATPLSAEHLAQALLLDGEFRALGLGAWLTTPDGAVIAEGVGMVLPPYLRPEYGLWVEAMQKAAQLQYSEGQQKAGAVALANCVALVVFAIYSAIVTK